MGTHCCSHSPHPHPRSHESSEHPAASRPTSQEETQAQKRALLLALAVNVLVLGIEVFGGIVAQSEAILADAVHLTSHVVVILLSLLALDRSPRWKAHAALLKGLLVLALGLNLVVEALRAFLDPAHLPEVHVMSLVTLVALAGNLATLWIMARHRNEDLNMRSAWICSKADLLTNLGLIATSALVAFFEVGWPDAALGVILGATVVRSASGVVQSSFRAVRESLH